MNLISYARDPVGALHTLARERGDVAFYRFSRVPEVLISHPELVEQVLVTKQRAFTKARTLQEARRVLGDGLLTSEGEVHLRHRRLMAPMFHQRAIGAYCDQTVTLTDQAQRAWSDGDTFDMHEQMLQLTMAVVARTVFDVDVAGESKEFGEALVDVLEILTNRLVLPWGGALYRLPLPATRRFNRSRGRMNATIDRMLAERRRTGLQGRDLLSLLMSAVDEGDHLSDLDVRDEAMTVLLAGHETTAAWLSWTVMTLANDPELAEAVREEVRQVVGARPVAIDDLPNLELIDRVLHEVLRLYPPVWMIGRRAQEDVLLGEHTLVAGTVVVLCPFVVQRDARWFPDPERFDPDRWRDTSAQPRFAFFPFGGGVRRCIGEGFAWMEAKLILATLLRDWRFELTRPGPVAMLPRVSLRPRDGLPVVARRVT